MEPRFLVDVNVGRLAKWLRVMGYDALYIPGADDRELLRVAAEQDRVLITRDRRMMVRREVTRGRVRGVLVVSDDFREQMREVVDALGLGCHSTFSRCIECNMPLQGVCKQQVREKVPPFVFSTQELFYACSNCGKLYWRGTHWRNMRAELGCLTKGD